MHQVEKIGMVGPDGKLVMISELTSFGGGMFDGPVLWSNLDLAKLSDDNDCGLTDGYAYCRVTITVGEKLS